MLNTVLLRAFHGFSKTRSIRTFERRQGRSLHPADRVDGPALPAVLPSLPATPKHVADYLDGDIAGMWRPRKSGKSFRVQVNVWTKASTSVRNAIKEQAERLAAYRQVSLSGIDLDH